MPASLNVWLLEKLRSNCSCKSASLDLLTKVEILKSMTNIGATMVIYNKKEGKAFISKTSLP
jgi:hypothetical protein